MSGRPKHRLNLGAVGRIQKSKRARNVKRYSRHKQRRSLVEKLEDSREAGAIVALELGLPGVDEELREEEMLRQVTAKKTKKAKRLPMRDETAETGKAAEKCSSSTDHKEDYIEGSNINTSLQQNDGEGTRLRASLKKERFPFQKEMKLREASRLEREKERQRIKEETEAYYQRREESRKARKKQGKQFRKVTRRGQPVLKHRIDALLQEIQKK